MSEYESHFIVGNAYTTTYNSYIFDSLVLILITQVAALLMKINLLSLHCPKSQNCPKYTLNNVAKAIR